MWWCVINQSCNACLHDQLFSMPSSFITWSGELSEWVWVSCLCETALCWSAAGVTPCWCFSLTLRVLVYCNHLSLWPVHWELAQCSLQTGKISVNFTHRLQSVYILDALAEGKPEATCYLICNLAFEVKRKKKKQTTCWVQFWPEVETSTFWAEYMFVQPGQTVPVYPRFRMHTGSGTRVKRKSSHKPVPDILWRKCLQYFSVFCVQNYVFQ